MDFPKRLFAKFQFKGGWKEIKKSYELLKKPFINVYMEFDNQELDMIQEHNIDPSTRRGSTHLFGWKTSYRLPSMERIMIMRRIKFIHFTQFGVIGMCCTPWVVISIKVSVHFEGKGSQAMHESAYQGSYPNLAYSQIFASRPLLAKRIWYTLWEIYCLRRYLYVYLNVHV